jgi:sulfatase modifying factor 1
MTMKKIVDTVLANNRTIARLRHSSKLFRQKTLWPNEGNGAIMFWPRSSFKKFSWVVFAVLMVMFLQVLSCAADAKEAVFYEGAAQFSTTNQGFADNPTGAWRPQPNSAPIEAIAFGSMLLSRPSVLGNIALVSTNIADSRVVGQVFRDCEGCPEMVVIPAGTFRMGSPQNEAGRMNSEEPRRQISIKSFAAGRFEVTRKEFAEFVNETSRDMSNPCRYWNGAVNDEPKRQVEWRNDLSWLNPGYTQADNHPVTCVSWHDARAYVRWLSARTGKPYRLMTETEWEYAARAGSTSRYSFGDNLNALCSFGNGADQSLHRQFPTIVTANCDDGYLYTAPVGSFSPNAFGLYDMHGNISEWVQDCFRLTYDTGRTDGRAVEPRVCQPSRVFRGGSWGNRPAALRSAARLEFHRNGASNTAGIRVARSLP